MQRWPLGKGRAASQPGPHRRRRARENSTPREALPNRSQRETPLPLPSSHPAPVGNWPGHQGQYNCLTVVAAFCRKAKTLISLYLRLHMMNFGMAAPAPQFQPPSAPYPNTYPAMAPPIYNSYEYSSPVPAPQYPTMTYGSPQPQVVYVSNMR